MTGQLNLIDQPIVPCSIIHRTFTPGNGEICKVHAQCNLCVVVEWLVRKTDRRKIILREEFDRDYVEIDLRDPEQGALF